MAGLRGGAPRQQEPEAKRHLHELANRKVNARLIMNSRATATSKDLHAQVLGLVSRARSAMEAFPNDNQDTVDMAVRALAWAVFQPDHAALLAGMAVADTGFGCVESKTAKNRRKTFGTLRDLLRAKTVGIIDEDPSRGLVT